MGLTVVGGRVADIGVGGLTLRGGVSYFSGRYGWAYDNATNYQVKCLMFNWSRAKKSRLSSQTDRSVMSITTQIQIYISL
jgi:hypothetical protein